MFISHFLFFTLSSHAKVSPRLWQNYVLRNSEEDSSLSVEWLPRRKKSLLIDYEKVIAKRRANYEYLHKTLGKENQVNLPTIDSYACPMVYPFLGSDENLRSKMIENKIFVARYWPNALEWCKENDIEYKFAKCLLPLPCDQRYEEEDMERIIQTIEE